MEELNKQFFIEMYKHIHNDVESLKNLQIEGRERLTKIETQLGIHLKNTEKSNVSKKEKAYFILGLIGSYALGILTEFLN